jgi:uncharacterized BrkB/YihY/UPF0761 family membrane protein
MASVRRAGQLAEAGWDRSVRAVPALDLGVELIGRFGRLNGSVLVGHIAYRSFIWVMPLLLVAIGLLGYGATQGLDIVRYGHEAGLDQAMLETASEETSNAGLSILLVGGTALIVATRSLVRALYLVFAQAWEVEPRLPHKILRAIGLTLLGALVVVALTSVVNALAGRGPVLLVGAGVAGTAVTGVLLLAVGWFLPHRADTIFDLVPGTIAAVTGIVLINLLGGLYFPRRLSEASQTYGAIGFTLVFLFFLWLWAFLLVASAFINSVWCDRRVILDGRPYVASPELLPDWIRRMLPHERDPDDHGNHPPA